MGFGSLPDCEPADLALLAYESQAIPGLCLGPSSFINYS